MKIIKNKRECDIEKFNLPNDISISKVYWWDVVACIYVSKAGSDEDAGFVFFLNCQNKLPQQAVKMYSKLKM